MAKKRMIAQSIIGSGTFLRMPFSAQALYAQLNVNGDDDGYVEYYAVMEYTGCKPADLTRLQEDNFIHVFSNDILLILDWTEHNSIKPSRKKDSKFLKIYPMSDKCRTSVAQVAAEVRLGEVSIVEVSRGKDKATKKSVALPVFLDKKAWSDWVQYKKEKKQKLTPSTITSQLKFLELHKKDHVAIIENSIMNDWTGLFKLDHNQKASNKKPANHLPAERGKYDDE